MKRLFALLGVLTAISIWTGTASAQTKTTIGTTSNQASLDTRPNSIDRPVKGRLPKDRTLPERSTPPRPGVDQPGGISSDPTSPKP